MNKTQLDEALNFLFNPQGELQIIIYALTNQNEEAKKLDIKESDLSIFKTLFVNSVKNSIIDKNDFVILPLSTADERGKSFYQYDLEIPNQLQLLESVIGNDRLNNFNFQHSKFSDIKALIIVFADNNNEITLFKKISPIEIIGRGGNLLKKSNQRLEKFDEELLRISAKFQVIRVNNEIIIIDLLSIEKSFGIHDVIIREASVSLESVNQMNIVSNIESLSELINDITFARKLTKIARSSPVLRLRIPNLNIITFAKTHPLTKKKIRLNADETKFNLDTRVSKELFIKILNDDLLTSELTKLYYDTLAKDGIEVEEENNIEIT
ncbi:anti-phage protein KwaB [Chryseobacterium sp. CT-SW4]|uniref:anti-phage protein KwaB n=1 Tax=Chryseobacterium sp. SW-1 TaxID=3157343 RepID=UPI003B01E2F1